MRGGTVGRAAGAAVVGQQGSCLAAAAQPRTGRQWASSKHLACAAQGIHPSSREAPLTRLVPPRPPLALQEFFNEIKTCSQDAVDAVGCCVETLDQAWTQLADEAADLKKQGQDPSAAMKMRDLLAISGQALRATLAVG